MNGRMTVLAVLVVALSLTAGCSTSTPGGRRLYDDSEPPRLLDSEVRMETTRKLRGDKTPDVRVVRVKGGIITCSLRSDARGVMGEGTMTAKEYGEIWEQIDNLGGFDQKSEPPDPSGGYFHAITFRLARRQGQTSAQNRSNFLGLGTTEIQARLSLANAITRAVERNVNLGPIPDEPERAETEEKPEPVK